MGYIVRAGILTGGFLLAGCAGLTNFNSSQTAKSGVEKRIAYAVSYGPSCMGRPPSEMTILKKPDHGAVSVRSTEVIYRPSSGETCIGPAIAVFYTSEPGYKGIDQLIYHRQDMLNSQDWTVDIKVD